MAPFTFSSGSQSTEHIFRSGFRQFYDFSIFTAACLTSLPEITPSLELEDGYRFIVAT